MKQKLIKVGNSYAVTIPRHFVDSLKIEFDRRVRVHADESTGKVEIDFMPEKGVVDQVIDPEVYSVAKDLLRRYLPAFQELAKR